MIYNTFSWNFQSVTDAQGVYGLIDRARALAGCVCESHFRAFSMFFNIFHMFVSLFFNRKNIHNDYFSSCSVSFKLMFHNSISRFLNIFQRFFNVSQYSSPFHFVIFRNNIFINTFSHFSVFLNISH